MRECSAEVDKANFPAFPGLIMMFYKKLNKINATECLGTIFFLFLSGFRFNKIKKEKNFTTMQSTHI